MVDRYADKSVVTAILVQQKENMRALHNELSAEIAAISTRDADKLTASASAKLTLLEKIQKKDLTEVQDKSIRSSLSPLKKINKVTMTIHIRCCMIHGTLQANISLL